MTETKRWAIALIVSLLITFGGSYWVTTINQARMDITVTQIIRDVEIADRRGIENAKQITQNRITLTEVNLGWKSVAKAVEANTAQLTKFTEVLIRLEERDKLSYRREAKKE
jgi:hypothetical protein